MYGHTFLLFLGLLVILSKASSTQVTQKNENWKIPPHILRKMFQIKEDDIDTKNQLQHYWKNSERITSNNSQAFACPENFKLANAEYPTCYIITEPQSFPPKCPYENFHPTETLYNEGFWLMVTRNTTDGFGPFKWTPSSSFYGNYMNSYEEAENILEKNCMIMQNRSVVPVRCDEKHPFLCVYSHRKMVRYCETHFGDLSGYSKCIPDSFDVEHHNCYCITKHRKQPRDGFCKILAKPPLEYQNNLLTTQLQSNHQCWFGIYTDGNNKSRSFNQNGKTQLKALQLPSSSCAFCQIKNKYDKQVSLELMYIRSNDQIRLTIKNPLELSDKFNVYYALFCFFGPTKNSFQERLAIFKDFNKQEEVVYYYNNSLSFPVYYWCEGFQRPTFSPVYSNTLLVYPKNRGLEYSLQVKVRAYKDKDPYLDQIHLRACTYITKKIGLITNIIEKDGIFRVMKVLKYDPAEAYLEMVLHLTTVLIEDDVEEYQQLSDHLDLIFAKDRFLLNLTNFRRIDLCMPTITVLGNHTQHWGKTKIGDVAQIIKENGEAITRKCEGNFLQGAFWGKVSGSSKEGKNITRREEQLIDLFNDHNITAKKFNLSLKQITEDGANITFKEVYMISRALEKLESFGSVVNSSDFIRIISNIMNFNAVVLRTSQEELNSTEKILGSLEKILTHVERYQDSIYSVITSPRLLVQMSDLKQSKIIGVALKRKSNHGSFKDFTLIPIYKDITIEVSTDDIELAAYIPEKLIIELKSHEDLTNCPIKLIFSLFYNDVMFNKNYGSNNITLSILMYGLKCKNSIILKVLVQTDFKQNCTYENVIVENITTNSPYIIYQPKRATHSSMLIFAGMSEESLFERGSTVLNVITTTGTAISLASILSMYILAIRNRSWRQGSSNKILLNFSLAIALKMLMLYIAYHIRENGIWCTIAGVILHYSLLSGFCWMLIIAILQYRRFVLVLHAHITHVVAKSCIFCWCVPFVPITMLRIISRDSYIKNECRLCFPSGTLLYAGVIFPITAIVITNFIVFIKILFAMFSKKIKSYGDKHGDIRMHITLAVFLFFHLGINWIFGLAVAFGAGTAFSYLFCLTSALQGLSMLLYYVAMNTNKKKIQIKIKNNIFRGSYDRRTLTSEFSSMRDIKDARSNTSSIIVEIERF